MMDILCSQTQQAAKSRTKSARTNIYNLCCHPSHVPGCKSSPALTESPLLPLRSAPHGIPPSPGWAGSPPPAERSRCGSGPTWVCWLQSHSKRRTGCGGLEPVASPSPGVLTSCTTAWTYCRYPWMMDLNASQTSSWTTSRPLLRPCMILRAWDEVLKKYWLTHTEE